MLKLVIARMTKKCLTPLENDDNQPSVKLIVLLEVEVPQQLLLLWHIYNLIKSFSLVNQPSQSNLQATASLTLN
jgi:hypothetical protein